MKMLKVYFSLCLFSLFSFYSSGQIVKFIPENESSDGVARLVFDASLGNKELLNQSSVYCHLGAVVNAPNGVEWSHVIGNWGQDDGVGKMTKVEGQDNQWEIKFPKGLHDYFSIHPTTEIYRLAAVFRSPDGSLKGTDAPGTYDWGTIASNLDYFINISTENYVTILSPDQNLRYVENGDSLYCEVFSSQPADELSLWISQGQSYVEIAKESNTQTLTTSYLLTNSGNYFFRAIAIIGTDTLVETVSRPIVIIPSSNIAEVPDGNVPGINYDESDETSATLVLEAPGKKFVYVIGDFTNWQIDSSKQMHRSPDGEMFWLTIDDLTPTKPYVFQYLVDGEIYIADPYADQIADPWNDRFIDASTFPDLPAYDKTSQGIASVLETGQEKFSWDESEEKWSRPEEEHLVIYELLPRDFIGKHDWQTLTDTLSYIKRLGVDAIEIMPFNEFDGNDSWGYNPAVYFAPDKYYGTKEALKTFIQVAHQQDLAIIMDIVLNHAYGQNPMVKLYFDSSTNTPSSDNPWFNKDYVGPYQWGYDWNHESDYTKRFVDRVCDYWLREYHVDGFRFDFTKGMTNYAPNGNIEGFDQSRIDILDRMGQAIQLAHPGAYMILEHWGPYEEEQILAQKGFKMWSNRSYDFVPAATGNYTNSMSDLNRESHVQFYDSHDENRIANHILNEGRQYQSYNTQDLPIMYERAKMAAAFLFIHPGPKMLWQFDELAYDIDINFGGRLGRKPMPWGANGLGYYEDSERQKIYSLYSEILSLRKKLKPEKMANASIKQNSSGDIRYFIYDTDSIDLVLVGNFGLEKKTGTIPFSEGGLWIDYFFGDSITVESSLTHSFAPGEWRLFTNSNLVASQQGLVSLFENPFSITPDKFTLDDEIIIEFDLDKASVVGNSESFEFGESIYLISGLVKNGEWFHVQSMSEMLPSSKSSNTWTISMTPREFYGLQQDEEFLKIGMYVSTKDGLAQGYGFGHDTIYFDIQTQGDFITVSPSSWQTDEEITITLDVSQGNRELLDATKIYMHSSAFTSEQSPQNSQWNYVVGNWGEDDGVGQLSKVSGSEYLWEIKITPKSYYDLGDNPCYWLGMVFRNENGSQKATHPAGSLEQGFVHTNFDVFIQNQTNTALIDLSDSPEIAVGPTPTSGLLKIDLGKYEREECQVYLYDSSGRLVRSKAAGTKNLEISDLNSGVYQLILQSDQFYFNKKIILIH